MISPTSHHLAPAQGQARRLAAIPLRACSPLAENRAARISRDGAGKLSRFWRRLELKGPVIINGCISYLINVKQNVPVQESNLSFWPARLGF
jgi:hypothetical protein